MTRESPITFAFHVHRDHKRKYTGEPYTGHLAEVAGLTAAAIVKPECRSDAGTAVAVAWLHDCVEHVGVSLDDLNTRFGRDVRDGVEWLSDLDKGDRETVKRLSRERLAGAPGWVQTIKVADIISNTTSIQQHDPEAAPQDFKEKSALLDVLANADDELLSIARKLMDKCSI